MIVILRVLECDGGDRIYLCAEQAEKVDFALRLRVWHVDDEFVAFGAADVGEAYASVPCCAFDDGAAWLQEACFLGMFDDEERCAVFYGAAGVLEFGLS